MLDEGDKLADQGQFTEAVIRYKRGMEQLLPQLRKIPFKHEVKRDVTKRENMKALILKEIDEDMTPAEFRANELAMKAFGLLPRDFNLRETIAQVYAEEVAAFYDPKTKTMHLIEEPKVEKKKPPTLLERLFGKKDEFDKDENKTVIAHELTHALADQHYDLDAMQEAVKKDDDRSTGHLGTDRGRGDPGHVRRRHGRLGWGRNRQTACRESRVDLQLAVVVPCHFWEGERPSGMLLQSSASR